MKFFSKEYNSNGYEKLIHRGVDINTKGFVEAYRKSLFKTLIRKPMMVIDLLRAKIDRKSLNPYYMTKELYERINNVS